MSDLHFVTDEEQHAKERQFFAEMKAAGTPFCERCWLPLDGDTCQRQCAWVYPPEYLDACSRTEVYDYAAVDSPIVIDYVPPSDRDRQIVALYERIQGQVERDANVAPNGCAGCGTDERGHEIRWTYVFQGVRRRFHDWHPFQTPTDAQRLGRMLARRHQGWQAWREINRRFSLQLPSITT